VEYGIEVGILGSVLNATYFNASRGHDQAGAPVLSRASIGVARVFKFNLGSFNLDCEIYLHSAHMPLGTGTTKHHCLNI